MKDDKVDQLIRMMRLLKLLETSERTIASLALETGISQRTVVRYIKAFRSVGFCIVSNNSNEFTLLNNYGVPHLKLTPCEIESLIILYTDYYSLYSQVPSITVETALFKIAESTSPNMVSFLKQALHCNDGEVISNMFNLVETRLISHAVRRL